MNIRKRISSLVLILSIITYTSSVANAQEEDSSDSLMDTIGQDYSNFYANSDRWIRFGVAFGSMGVVANTAIDQNIQDWYQDDIRSQSTDDFAKIAKVFGEGTYLIPISLLASSIYLIDDDSTIAFWGSRVARSYLVGAPALLITQPLTGGSRPSDSTVDTGENSNWNLFNDENGVSGHSFMGAVPFIVIAKMSDNIYVKYSAYLASTLATWSRINDNQHYTSQSVLGWYLAYESVNSVFDTDSKQDKFTFAPMIAKDFYGITISSKW